MNLRDWIDALCDELDLDIDMDQTLILDLAREAAHNVTRPAAPVSTFLVGYAAGLAKADPDEVERLSGIAFDLVAEWARTGGGADVEALDPEVEVDLDDAE